MLASKKVIVTDSFILFHLLNSEKKFICSFNHWSIERVVDA